MAFVISDSDYVAEYFIVIVNSHATSPLLDVLSYYLMGQRERVERYDVGSLEFSFGVWRSQKKEGVFIVRVGLSSLILTDSSVNGFREGALGETGALLCVVIVWVPQWQMKNGQLESLLVLGLCWFYFYTASDPYRYDYDGLCPSGLNRLLIFFSMPTAYEVFFLSL